MAGPVQWPYGPIVGGFFTPTETQLVAGIDASLGDVAQIVLTADRVMGAPVNPTAGQLMTLLFVQDGTGGHTLFSPAWLHGAVGGQDSANKRYAFRMHFDGVAWTRAGSPAPWAL